MRQDTTSTLRITKKALRYIFSGWPRVAVVLLVCSVISLHIFTSVPAYADTGGYPWWNAPCAWNGDTTGSCSGYDWGEQTCPTGDGYCTAGNEIGTYYQDDQWGEGFRNCTSYVAWKLNQVFGANIVSDWHNGTDWNASALDAGYSDDTSPQVGDIAQWNGTTENPDGHVAYVYAVNSGVASYDEYNYLKDGNFLSTYTSASGSQGAPDHYIHIGTVNAQTAGNIALNGNFGQGGNDWSTASGANFAIYSDDEYGYRSYGQDGGYFGATNAPSSGGYIYQNVTDSVPSGGTVCVTAELRTDGSSTGGSGIMALYVNGVSSGSDPGGFVFSGLSNANNWTPVEACTTATTARNNVLLEFYTTTGGPTIDIADVDIHNTVDTNGNFNSGNSGWSAEAGANIANYNSDPYGQWGGAYLATNSPSSGGYIQQNMTDDTVTDNTVCATAEVRTDGSSTGGSGVLQLYLNGVSSGNDPGGFVFSGLSNGNNWTPVEACTIATTARNNVLVELSASYGSPTIDIADVDIHNSISQNGNFNDTSGANWAPASGANFAIYSDDEYGYRSFGQFGGDFAATNSPSAGGYLYQDIDISKSTDNTICATAEVRTDGSSTGGAGVFSVYLTGGSGNDQGNYAFSGLSNGNSWTPVEACAVATTNRSTVTVQVTPTGGSPTIDVANVDVH